MSQSDELNLNRQIVCSIIPKLSFDSHKGSCGRIGIIGGSRDFTGAPYYAALCSLKVGADLVYVICTKDAAPAIKSYSPELMVFPLLDSPTALEDISEILPKLHSVVIGPGLGRSESIRCVLNGIINRIKEIELPMILDADCLHFIYTSPQLVHGYKKATLTPNMVEFDKLFASVFNKDPSQNLKDSVKDLCKTLGGITIVRKGKEDVISDGNHVTVCTEETSPRRCGGQGDMVAGFMGTFAFWSHKAVDQKPASERNSNTLTPNIIAALGACMLTRRCNRLAFTKLGRSTTTTDMMKEVRSAFVSLFPVD